MCYDRTIRNHIAICYHRTIRHHIVISHDRTTRHVLMVTGLMIFFSAPSLYLEPNLSSPLMSSSTLVFKFFKRSWRRTWEITDENATVKYIDVNVTKDMWRSFTLHSLSFCILLFHLPPALPSLHTGPIRCSTSHGFYVAFQVFCITCAHPTVFGRMWSLYDFVPTFLFHCAPTPSADLTCRQWRLLCLFSTFR